MGAKVFIEKCEDGHKYKFVVTDKKVIAISTFAKQHVRGVAVCAPDDKFDEETGKKLARLRCAAKIAEKRLKEATNWFEYCSQMLSYWKDEHDNSNNYASDAFEKYYKICNELTDFYNSI